MVRSQRVQTIRVTGLATELDLERIVGEKLHDRTDLARQKAKLGHVCEECYSVEELNR